MWHFFYLENTAATRGGESVREERVSEGQWHLSFNRHMVNWTSCAAKAYNTAAVHFIDGDWSLRTGVLETASFPGSHTGVTHTHTRARART